MRKYTLLLSIVVHAAAIAAAMTARIVATDELPVPPRSTTFVEVRPLSPAPAPAPPARRQGSPAAAPVAEPAEIAPEPPYDPVQDLFAAPAAPDAAAASYGDPGGLPGLVLPPPPPPAEAPRAPLRVGGAIEAPGNSCTFRPSTRRWPVPPA